MTATSISRAGAISLDYRLAPLPAAICYPLFLSSAYGAMHGVAGAPSVEARLAAILMTVVSVAAAFAVPWVAALTAARIARSPQRSRADVQRYRLAHLVFAAPPLYTGIGVITSVIGIGPFDLMIWLALWLGLGLFVAAAPADVPADEAHPPTARAVATHGGIAAAVLVVFLTWHLANHVLALWSPALHQSAMKRLEHIYRARAIEPLLIAGMALLAGTGMRLAWRHTLLQGDGYRLLQTLTGFYLAAFVLSHLTAILILARWQGHVDTGTWAYESAAPDGLFGNPWNPRLLPHYSIVAWAVITHAGLGLRGVLRAHGIADRTANLVAKVAGVAGAGASLAISAALLGVHLGTS